LKVNRIRGDLAPKCYSSTKKKLLVLVHKEVPVPEADDKKVPEADDKTSGECLPLTHGVGGGQQGQGLQKPHLQKTKTKSQGLKPGEQRSKEIFSVYLRVFPNSGSKTLKVIQRLR
jgi:hypothetical protein